MWIDFQRLAKLLDAQLRLLEPAWEHDAQIGVQVRPQADRQRWVLAPSTLPR